MRLDFEPLVTLWTEAAADRLYVSFEGAGHETSYTSTRLARFGASMSLVLLAVGYLEVLGSQLATVERVARYSGLAESTARKHLARLTELGYLARFKDYLHADRHADSGVRRLVTYYRTVR